MALQSEAGATAEDLPIGSHHYRAFIGSPDEYDIMGATQFNLLTFLGLQEHHFLLDIGCGSLRAGRLLIPYLLKGHYFGMEPEAWLIEEAITREIGEDLIAIKQPAFSYDDNFTLSTFNQTFDFILAQSVFSHASQSQIRRCLSEAKKVMEAGSIFAVNFYEGPQDYTGDKWVYPEVVTYTFDRLRSLVEEQGLTCKRIPWPRMAKLTWVAIVTPEHDGNIPGSNDVHVQLLSLQNELGLCRKRLSEIEDHPYVKFGLWINRFLHQLRWKL